jgi:hypothetical protein
MCIKNKMSFTFLWKNQVNLFRATVYPTKNDPIDVEFTVSLLTFSVYLTLLTLIPGILVFLNYFMPGTLMFLIAISGFVSLSVIAKCDDLFKLYLDNYSELNRFSDCKEINQNDTDEEDEEPLVKKEYERKVEFVESNNTDLDHQGRNYSED